MIFIVEVSWVNDIDYRDLIDIAKLNLIQKINLKMKEYYERPNDEIKKEIINLLKEKQKLYLFDVEIIKKYL